MDGWDNIWNVPISGSTAVRVGTWNNVGNYTVTSSAGGMEASRGEMFEGCVKVYGTPGYFQCHYRSVNVSIKDYNRSGWAYYGGALKSTFVNTGTAATCLYALYHADPDITACM